MTMTPESVMAEALEAEWCLLGENNIITFVATPTAYVEISWKVEDGVMVPKSRGTTYGVGPYLNIQVWKRTADSARYELRTVRKNVANGTWSSWTGPFPDCLAVSPGVWVEEIQS